MELLATCLAPCRQSEYKYDKLNGPHEDYYTDGKLCAKGLYLNNQNIGLWLKYNSYFLKYDKLFYL